MIPKVLLFHIHFCDPMEIRLRIGPQCQGNKIGTVRRLSPEAPGHNKSSTP